jgi:hypothetical protein
MLTRNTDVSELKQPGPWEAHAKVNVWCDTTFGGLVSSENVGQNFKVRPSEATVTLHVVHLVAVMTRSLFSDRGVQIDRTLLVTTARACVVTMRAILTHVLRAVVGNEGIEVLPIGGLKQR